jgi:hypothetical protein
MSDIAVVAGGRAAWQDAPDTRRVLQLALAGLWLLDALLQYQPMMFSRAFGQTLAATADGNPRFIARPITWDATLIQRHAVALNVVFATIQLLLGLGIAFRPTVRLALAASVAWAVGVWWFGEGLGGVLTGTASPVTGAPGAAILYALLAVLLWPARGAGALARPGLAHAAAREPGAVGAARHAGGDGERRARPDGRPRAGRGGRYRRPRAGRLDRAGSGVHARRRRRVPAPARGRDHPGAGHRDRRGDLGDGGGVRDDPGRRGDRPGLRSAARLAGASLLAGEDGPGEGGRPR